MYSTRIYQDLYELTHSDNPGPILKRINATLLEYRDYIHLHPNDLDADRLAELKQRVRTAQIEAYEIQKDATHRKRLKKYFQDNKENASGVSDREKLMGSCKAAQTSDAVNDQILSHNKQITSSLQATRQLLSSSILQSELNIDTLDQQTKDMTHLNEEFVKFSDLLQKSRQIVKFIEKQDKGDKQRIYMSLGFFFLVCAWIIWKRILRMPVRLLLWTMLRTFGIVNWVFGPGTPTPNSFTETVAVVSATVASVDGTEIPIENMSWETI